MVATTLDTAPATEPLSTDEAKDHERVDISADDELIDNLVKAARSWSETFTSRAFVTQTWKLFLDEFPDEEEIKVPKPPLQSVTHVQYTTYDGSTDTTSTVDSDTYRVDTDREPGRIVLKDDADWPDPSDNLITSNPVEVEFVAGYGSDASDVPEDIRSAIRMLFGHLYENRESVVIGTTGFEVPFSVRSLLWPHRMDITG